jgi:hypothetical protein
MHTSSTPSSISALGVIIIPPAYERVLPTATSHASPAHSVSSTRTCTGRGR